MSKTLIGLIVISIVFIFGAVVAKARGGPAQFESNMVTTVSPQVVDGAECRINYYPTAKIEIPYVSPETYTCCIEFDGGSIEVDTVTVEEPGELKCEDDLPAFGVVGMVVCTVYVGEDCVGYPVYESGADLGTP